MGKLFQHRCLGGSMVCAGCVQLLGRPSLQLRQGEAAYWTSTARLKAQHNTTCRASPRMSSSLCVILHSACKMYCLLARFCMTRLWDLFCWAPFFSEKHYSIRSFLYKDPSQLANLLGRIVSLIFTGALRRKFHILHFGAGARLKS